jgi:hypothetical protein
MYNPIVVEMCKQTIQLWLSLPARSRIRNTELQTTLCEIFFTIVLSQGRKCQYFTKEGTDNTCSSAFVVKIESLTTNSTILRHYKYCIADYKNVLAPNIYKEILVLMYLVQKGNTLLVQHLLNKILHFKESIPYAPIEYPEMDSIKPALRSDIVWVLWKVLLKLCSTSASKSKHIHDLLYLYCFRFQKKNRFPRLNLLFGAYLCAIDNNNIQSKHLPGAQLALIEEATEKCTSLFEEILGSIVPKTEDFQTDTCIENDNNDAIESNLSGNPSKVVKDLVYNSNYYYEGVNYKDKYKTRKSKKSKSKSKSCDKTTADKKDEMPMYMRMFTRYDVPK